MEPSSSVAGGSGVRTRNRVAAAALAVVAAAGGLALAQPDDEVGDNTVRVFRDAQFKGKEQVIHPV
ncbi:MAG: hypothetical protein ACYSWT_14810, partial [Planctomycetota bacterium]